MRMRLTRPQNSTAELPLTPQSMDRVAPWVCNLHEWILFLNPSVLCVIGKLAWYFTKTAGQFGKKKLGGGVARSIKGKTYFIRGEK